MAPNRPARPVEQTSTQQGSTSRKRAASEQAAPTKPHQKQRKIAFPPTDKSIENLAGDMQRVSVGPDARASQRTANVTKSTNNTGGDESGDSTEMSADIAWSALDANRTLEDEKKIARGDLDAIAAASSSNAQPDAAPFPEKGYVHDDDHLELCETYNEILDWLHDSSEFATKLRTMVAEKNEPSDSQRQNPQQFDNKGRSDDYSILARAERLAKTDDFSDARRQEPQHQEPQHQEHHHQVPQHCLNDTRRDYEEIMARAETLPTSSKLYRVLAKPDIREPYASKESRKAAIAKSTKKDQIEALLRSTEARLDESEKKCAATMALVKIFVFMSAPDMSPSPAVYTRQNLEEDVAKGIFTAQGVVELMVDTVNVNGKEYHFDNAFEALHSITDDRGVRIYKGKLPMLMDVDLAKDRVTHNMQVLKRLMRKLGPCEKVDGLADAECE